MFNLPDGTNNPRPWMTYDTTAGPFRITGTGTTLIFTNTRAPFLNTIVDAKGLTQLVFSPVPDSLHSDQMSLDIPETVISLPTLIVDGHYLQTLSDLRSDRRTVLLFSAAGAFIRSTHLDVPIGFVAVEPSLNVLVAVRRSDRVEIVKYRWRWVRESESNDALN